MGYTDSTDFPVRNALRATAAGQGDAFVVKVNPAGEAFAYATYLGGRSVAAVGGAGNPQNSLCAVNLAQSSASASASTLSVNFALSFTTAFAGNKQVSARILDTMGLNSGWKATGNWTVVASR